MLREERQVSESKVNRRTVLAGVGGLAATLAVHPLVAAGRGDRVEVTDISDRVFVIGGAGGNICVVRGEGASVAVDSGDPGHAREIQRLLRDRCRSAPLKTAFNTHWHPDHTGGNDLLRRDNVEIVAHENTRLWMGAPVMSRWDGAKYAPRPESAWPTKTFYTRETLTVGGEPVESGYLLQAHTDGDIYVRFPKANVLATGDVFTTDRYPISDPATLGWIGGLTTATEKLLDQCDANTRIVPGSGPVAGRSAVEAQLKMLTAVRDRLYALLREGRSVEEMLAARPTAEFDAQWGDPERFIRAAFAGMVAHVRQIPGIV
jgi:cyclase